MLGLRTRCGVHRVFLLPKIKLKCKFAIALIALWLYNVAIGLRRVKRLKQLISGGGVLDIRNLENLLQENFGSDFSAFKEIDSTSSYLRREAASLPDGYFACALSQTAGRGRHGKTFVSPRGGIYLSLLLRPQCSAEDACAMTAYAAVAVCRAIEKTCNVSPQIKWVNDIILGGKKICGILSELVFSDDGGIQYIIIGAGINANVAAENFAGELSAIAGSVCEHTNTPVDEENLTLALIENLRSVLSAFPDNRREILAEYRERCATIGKEIRICENGGTVHAFAEAVDDDFRLVVTDKDGARRILLGGDVSVRGLCGYI